VSQCPNGGWRKRQGTIVSPTLNSDCSAQDKLRELELVSKECLATKILKCGQKFSTTPVNEMVRKTSGDTIFYSREGGAFWDKLAHRSSGKSNTLGIS
jgi:hypothetical protein